MRAITRSRRSPSVARRPSARRRAVRSLGALPPACLGQRRRLLRHRRSVPRRRRRLAARLLDPLPLLRLLGHVYLARSLPLVALDHLLVKPVHLVVPFSHNQRLEEAVCSVHLHLLVHLVSPLSVLQAHQHSVLLVCQLLALQAHLPLELHRRALLVAQMVPLAFLAHPFLVLQVHQHFDRQVHLLLELLQLLLLEQQLLLPSVLELLLPLVNQLRCLAAHLLGPHLSVLRVHLLEQTATPTFGSPGFGQTTFFSQQVGSRVVPYSATPDADGALSGQTPGKLESISAMPQYKEKSHEELRWEDYQNGDKGSSLFGQKPAFGGFGSSPSQTSPCGGAFQSQPAFGGSSVFGSPTPLVASR